MKVADCAVGVHGSNLLLASGLAKSTIELVARSRFGNILQTTLFSPRNIKGAKSDDCHYHS